MQAETSWYACGHDLAGEALTGHEAMRVPFPRAMRGAGFGHALHEAQLAMEVRGYEAAMVHGMAGMQNRHPEVGQHRERNQPPAPGAKAGDVILLVLQPAQKSCSPNGSGRQPPTLLEPMFRSMTSTRTDDCCARLTSGIHPWRGQ